MIFRILPVQRKENETEIVRRGPVVGFGKPVRPNRVRLAVHKSFSLPQSVIAQFEKANDAKVSVIKAGSGNEMLNKLI